MEVYIPILQDMFQLSWEGIELSDKWRIIRFPGHAVTRIKKQEKRQILVTLSTYDEETDLVELSWYHVLSTEIANWGNANWRNPLDEALIILRLYKSGFVHLKWVIDAENLKKQCQVDGMQYYIPWIIRDGESKGIEHPMKIGVDDEIECLKNHFQKYQSIHPSIHASLRMFTNLYFLPRDVYRFINLAMTLDGLLSFPQEITGGAIEFSNRLSNIIRPGHDKKERDFHERCLKFYLKRGIVVHGKGNIQQQEFFKETDEFDGYCREIIWKFHDPNDKKNPWHNLTNGNDHQNFINDKRIIPCCDCGIDKDDEEYVRLELAQEFEVQEYIHAKMNDPKWKYRNHPKFQKFHNRK